MNKKKITAIISIALYFFVVFNASTILQLIGIDVKNITENESILYSALLELILMIIIMLLHFKTLSEDWKDFKKNYRTYIKKYGPYWFKMLGLMVIANILIMALSGQTSSTNEESIRAIMKMSKAYIVFSSVIYAPVVEELVFRQSIRDLIKNKWAFILTSGLVFGLIHCLGSDTLIGYLYVIPYAIPGCVFAYILYDSDNICNTMAMHLWHNTIMVILELVLISYM